MTSTDVTVVNGLISVKPLEHVGHALASCFRSKGVLVRCGGHLHGLAQLLGHRPDHKSAHHIPGHDPELRHLASPEQSCVPASQSSRIWRRPHSTVLFGVALRHAAQYCQIRVQARLLVFQSCHPHCISGRLLQHPSNCNFQLFATLGFLSFANYSETHDTLRCFSLTSSFSMTVICVCYVALTPHHRRLHDLLRRLFTHFRLVTVM